MPYVGMGQADDPLAVLAKTVLEPVAGPLKEKAVELGGTIANAVQPVVREELEAQVPKFALIAGISFGAMLVLGVSLGLLTTKERKKSR